MVDKNTELYHAAKSAWEEYDKEFELSKDIEKFGETKLYMDTLDKAMWKLRNILYD